MHHGHPWGGNPFFDGPWGRLQMLQARRGDMRGIILKSLLEKPMHGYEIIRSLEEASHGMWRPSPGSVYPMLQLLEEEELVTGRDENGKKVYSLTDAGKAAAEKAETNTPWTRQNSFTNKRELHKLAREALHALRTIFRSGDQDLMRQATTYLETTRNQLVELAHLAEDARRQR